MTSRTWCHGFDRACRARDGICTPQWAEQLTGVAAGEIVEAARMFARGPSCFISGHGIDAASNGVQTFRAYHCLFAISGNADRVGGNRRAKRPKGFKTNFDMLFDQAFRPPEVEGQRIGARKPALVRAARLSDGLPQRIRDRRDAHRPPLSGARALCEWRQHRGDLSGHCAHDRSPERPRPLRGRGAHHDTPPRPGPTSILPKTTTLEEEEITLNPKAPCVTYTARTRVSRRRREVRTSRIAAGLDRPPRATRRGRSEVSCHGARARNSTTSRPRCRDRHRVGTARRTATSRLPI